MGSNNLITIFYSNSYVKLLRIKSYVGIANPCVGLSNSYKEAFYLVYRI